MVKLIALYGKPQNPEAFEKHHREVHTPLVMNMPGLRKLEVSKVTGAPLGETKYYMMAEMYFADQNSLNAAMSSPEGRAAAKDLIGFAGNLVTMFHGEVHEEQTV